VVTRIVRSWLDDGVTELPDRVLDAVLDQVPATRQRRAWWPAWRLPLMNSAMRLGVAAVVVVILGAIGIGLAGSRGSSSVGVAPTATPGSQPPVACTPSTPIPGPSPTSRIAGALQVRAGTVLSAGTTYTTPYFTPAFTFVGQGCWISRGDDVSSAAIWNNPGDMGNGAVQIMRPGSVLDANGTPGPLPADLVAWIRARSDLSVGTPTSVSVGGYPGTLLDGTVLPSAKLNVGDAINIACAEGASASDLAAGNAFCLGFLGGSHFQLVLLSVRGQTVMIDLFATASNWTAAQPGLEAFLAGLKFPAGSNTGASASQTP
jgi:hypothetical protein